jgi:hypothetical protein
MFRRNIGWVANIRNDIIRSVGTTGADICACSRCFFCKYIWENKTTLFNSFASKINSRPWAVDQIQYAYQTKNKAPGVPTERCSIILLYFYPPDVPTEHY